MRYLLLLLLLTPCALAATQKTFTNASTYSFEEKTYTIYTIDKDYILLGQNNRTSILHTDECIASSLTRACLKSATPETAVFEETFLGPVLKAKQENTIKTTERGVPIEATITIENTGEQAAKNVLVTVELPEGLSLDERTEKRTYSWSGTIKEKTTLTYDITPQRNGTYAWNGTVKYNDGNATKEINLTQLTLTSTVPFTYKVSYDENTTGEPTPLNITITRKTTNNYTFTIAAEFPPETIINSTTRAAFTKGTTVTYRKQPNTTTLTFNALYSFRSQPSAPTRVTIQYENSTHEYTFTEILPYASPLDSEPAIAVRVNDFTTGEEGAVTLTITGNRTGWLLMNSSVYKTFREINAGTHTLPLTIKEPGNYTLDISFQSRSTYGDEHTAAGKVVLTAREPVPVTPVIETPPPAQNETPPAPEPVTEVPPEENHVLLVVLTSASIGLLAVLLLLIRAVRDPLRRIERLTEKTAHLREALNKKKRQGKATPQEEALLEALEAELRDLEKKL